MSARPRAAAAHASRRKVTLPALASMKGAGDKVVMVTAYDHPGALAAERAGVDIVLVGDSAAMTVLGHDSTTSVTIDEMLVLTAAVRRGLRVPLLVADLPFGSYEVSDAQAVATAVRFVKEAGCDAVKLEGGGPMSLSRVRAIIAAGIPVMGHVGLTPQTATALGGYKAQGRTAAAARRVAGEARALDEAGCFSVVFEAIPAQVAAEIRAELQAVVIGIGAGPDVDGQVLVFHDLLGMTTGGSARFVKRYADIGDLVVEGIERYATEVRDGTYPAPEHCYGIDAAELAAFRQS